MTHAATAGPSGWAWAAMAVSVLLLAGLSAGAYLLLSRGGRRAARHPSAGRRLAAQFARGQITQQEYLHLRDALDEPHAGGDRLDQPRGPRRRPRRRRAALGRTGRSDRTLPW
jgi:hypothetical protein